MSEKNELKPLVPVTITYKKRKPTRPVKLAIGYKKRKPMPRVEYRAVTKD